MYKFKFLIAQYLDDFPSNKTTVHYRRGGNLSQDITNCLSLRFLRANFLHLLHDYFIFDVSLSEFTNFSPNTVITLNIKLWIITETIGF